MLAGLKNRLVSFRKDRRGGVAVTFALAFTPVAFLSLVLIDYSRAATARSSLQETLDASTLIAARSTTILANDVDAVGDAAMKAQLASNLGIDGLTADGSNRIANATFAPSGTVITGTATASVSPIVANLFLGGPITIRATSEVVRSVNKLEIALVLDTTGSMDTSDRIGKLRTAASDFVTTMETAAARSSEVNPVKIALVPFSTTVKVSAPVSLTAYNNSTFTATGLPTWLDGRSRATPWNKEVFTLASASATRVDRFRMLKQMSTSWGGCVEARAAPYDVTDDPPTATGATASPTTAQAASMFTPWFWPDEPDSGYLINFGTMKNNYRSDGLSLSTPVAALKNWLNPQGRSAKYTAAPTSGTFSQGSGYGTNLVLGPNAGCNQQQLVRLSTNFSSLRTAISGLVSSGETNIPIGLAWGWHALSPNAPLANGVAYGTANTTKIIVLMTDGDNTMNDSGNDNDSWYHGYGYIWQNKLGTTSSSSSDRTTALNGRMALLCTNIKAKNIVIYTVGVGVSSSARTLLQNCATTTTQYYDVDTSGSNLNAAFDAIAGSISNLRISK